MMSQKQKIVLKIEDENKHPNVVEVSRQIAVCQVFEFHSRRQILVSGNDDHRLKFDVFQIKKWAQLCLHLRQEERDVAGHQTHPAKEEDREEPAGLLEHRRQLHHLFANKKLKEKEK